MKIPFLTKGRNKLEKEMNRYRHKQVIIIRDDLDLSLGKALAQGCHASARAVMKSNHSGLEQKIIVKADKETMLEKQEEAKKAGLPNYLVKDAGRTEVKPGTVTALAIGPAHPEKVDKITGSLPLLKDSL